MEVKMKNKIFILTILFSFLFIGTSFAVIYVPEDCSTIQGAIDYAEDHNISGASISVKAGTYNENIYLCDYTYYVGGGIHIYGRTGDPADTIIDGQGIQYVVRITNGEERDTIIEGFTITGGGTGVYIENASPVIKNCIITGNTKHGIRARVDTHWCPTCPSHPKIIRNKIIGNGGDSYSSGVFLDPYHDPEPTIFQNNIVADNYGSYAGGLEVSGDNVIVTNNTFVGNYNDYEADKAGGVVFSSSSIIFTNNIIWDNYTVHYYDPSQIVTYDNIDYYGSPPTINYNCIMGGWDGPGQDNIINRNPLIMPDYGLHPFSPCIDAGYFDHGLTIDWNDFYGFGHSLHDDQQVENTGADSQGTHKYKDIGAVENQGDSWILAVPSGGGAITDIQDAVDVAWDGAIIEVAPGTYGPVDTLHKKLTIKSTDGPETTIIDAGGSGDAVKLEHGEKIDYIDTILDGFTIRNGQRAIMCSGLDKKIINNNIIDNFSGGGIRLYDGTAEITDNVITAISNNSVGAVMRIERSAVLIKDNTISEGDTTGSGGGIYLSDVGPDFNCFEQEIELTSRTIERNTISDNEAGTLGGGIYLTDTDAEIKSNTITNNFADTSGGGIYFIDTTAALSNNLITKNSATNGGGIYFGTDIEIEFVEFVNDTIANNSATYSGAGMYVEDYSWLPKITNTIIWGNDSPHDPAIYLRVGCYPEINYSNIQDGPDVNGWEEGDGNINFNPYFLDPAAGDYNLGNFSKSIDAADGDAAPVKDMLDNLRYDDESVGNTGAGTINYVDIGALERQTNSSGEPNVLTVPSADYPTIQSAITDAVDNDTIMVNPGTYIENIVFNGYMITVKSTTGPYLTTIQGNVTFQNGESSNTVLEGFKITGGNLSGIRCNNYSNPTIKNNIIIGNNSVNEGGGIRCDESSPVIINNIIADNTATLYGGGIYCLKSSPEITNNTIVNNSASVEGGGVYCALWSDAIITNTIIWGNDAPHSPGFGENVSDPVVSYSDVQGGDTTNHNINTNPLLDNSYKLGNLSPCIDRANDNDATVPELDLKGNSRYDDPAMTNYEGSIVDIGALERQRQRKPRKKTAFPNF